MEKSNDLKTTNFQKKTFEKKSIKITEKLEKTHRPPEKTSLTPTKTTHRKHRTNVKTHVHDVIVSHVPRRAGK